MNKIAAAICGFCALSYAAAGASFFLDPTSALKPGTMEYWSMLATSPPARQSFLLAFACAGLAAFCSMSELQRLIGPEDGRIRLAVSLGWLGFGCTALTYFRILGGEAQRASAYAAGSDAVRQSIASFSLSLDPLGWLMFFCSGASLILFGIAGWKRHTIPTTLAMLGVASGALYIIAFLARLFQLMFIVDIAAALGGIIIGPVWWAWLARLFLASSNTTYRGSTQ